MLVESAFMARRLIGVHDSLAGSAVNNGYSGLKGSFRLGFITRGNGVDDFLNICAHFGAHTDVELASFFRLANAFSCLRGIGQNRNPICLPGFILTLSGSLIKTFNCAGSWQDVNP